MSRKIKKPSFSLQKIVLTGFIVLLVIKLILVGISYSYAFLQMGIWHSLYYFFTLVQSDFLILGIGLLLVWVLKKQKYFPLKWFFGLGILSLFALYFADLLVIFFFQQRLSFATGASFLSAGTNILLRYGMIFWIGFSFFSLFVFLLERFAVPKLHEKRFFGLMVASFLWYGIPFPQFRFLGVELPEKNILDKVARTSYNVSLASYQQNPELLLQKKLPLSQQELNTLVKRKKFWLELAKEHPEKIFQTFGHSSLKKAVDVYGNDYVFEVLSTAVATNPELAFTSLDQYQDWKDRSGNSLLKPLLQVAIKINPELAFRYLDRYQHVVEGNEKIAKSLLNYAVQQYKDPLTFEDLFHEVQGRHNKKNLILVFLESASVVDSQKFWALNNRVPLIDKVSNDGTSFTQMHANGTSSDMGHIASLLGVEPITFEYEAGTRYQNYFSYAPPLASFFTKLGYTTSFLSTASLDFLEQKGFLERIGYQNILWREAFEDKKRYTFDAAPDGDLYDKSIELVKTQHAPFFLTLQTISSHTPYHTPYGRTEESMYRYEDEMFAKFYEDLKKTDFFKNGILLVIGDHRKMTPLEDEEFAKRGPTAAAKILAFAIGKGIPAQQANGNLYQQTDLFYSLLREFWSGKVQVLENYNDLFSQEILRNWTVKHRYDQKKVNMADSEGHYGYIDLNRMQIVDGASFFPWDTILNYLKLSLAFQNHQQIKKADALSGTVKDKVYLIAHRGVTNTAVENSLSAFKHARDAGADGVELDVSATKEGKLVVYHGPKLSALTTCKQEKRDLCELSREELESCPLTDGQKILPLSEVLPQIKNWFPFVFLDFKVSENPVCDQDVERLFEETTALVKKNKMDSKVVFSSYDKKLTKLLGARGDLSSAVDTFSLADLNQLSGQYFSYFMTPVGNFSQSLTENLKKQAVEGVAYIVNDVQMFKKLKKMGVRFMMTDSLPQLQKALEND